MIKHNKKTYISTLILKISTVLLVGCSTGQKKADGRYFQFGSKNNSEATVWLEEVIVDERWRAPSTGILGCSSGNINGTRSTGSVSNKTTAPQSYLDIEWYSWANEKRMKARVKLPDSKIMNQLLLDPPWSSKRGSATGKSIIIIDFRPNHEVWVKLAKSADPKSESEVMILADGTGSSTDDVVTRYLHFREGDSYHKDCAAYRKRVVELGGYDGPFEVYDKWYMDFVDKEDDNE